MDIARSAIETVWTMRQSFSLEMENMVENLA